MNKKAQVMENLGKLGVGIASLAIILVVTFLIISTARTNIVTIESIGNVSDPGNLSTAYNATVTLANAVDDIPGWVPIVVITAIGAILIGMVSMFKRR